MKTYENIDQIKDTISKEQGYKKGWIDLPQWKESEIWPEVCRRAQEQALSNQKSQIENVFVRFDNEEIEDDSCVVDIIRDMVTKPIDPKNILS